MVTFGTILESIKRHGVLIVVITLVCACIGAASSFVRGGTVEVATQYTAEFALYPVVYGYQDGVNNGDEHYNYSLNETYALNDVRRIALSEDVSGAVRQQYGTDLAVSSPRWLQNETRSEYYSRYIFIDVTGTDADRVLAAAQAIADATVAKASEQVPLASISIAEAPALRGSTPNQAASWGTESFVDPTKVSAVVETAASINPRQVVIWALLGLFAAIVVFACYDILSRRVRSPRDVERLLEIPVIGVARPGQVPPQLIDGVDALLVRNDLKSFSVAGAVAGDGAEKLYDAFRDRLGDKAACVTDLADREGALAKVMSTDCVLLVLRYAAAKSRDLSLALQQLRLAGVPVLGAVFITKK